MSEDINIKNSFSINELEIISKEMNNSVFKITFNYDNSEENREGTGFLCKIPNPDFDHLLPVLITNNHVLKEKDINIGIKICISFKNEENIKFITIDSSRITYTNEKYDFTLIEIKKEDNIDFENFLEIDKSVYNEDLNEIQNISELYILHYSKEKEIILSLINYKKYEIPKTNLYYSCYTKKGASGSPIINKKKS